MTWGGVTGPRGAVGAADEGSGHRSSASRCPRASRNCGPSWTGRSAAAAVRARVPRAGNRPRERKPVRNGQGDGWRGGARSRPALIPPGDPGRTNLGPTRRGAGLPNASATGPSVERSLGPVPRGQRACQADHRARPVPGPPPPGHPPPRTGRDGKSAEDGGKEHLPLTRLAVPAPACLRPWRRPEQNRSPHQDLML